MERWLKVPGYETLYEVSDLGRVRSVDRTVCRGRTLVRLSGKPKAQKQHRDGYRVVGLSRDGAARSMSVHTLVAGAFLGPCPEGLEVRHLDGDPANNILSNLAYGTRAENMRDKARHGTHHNLAKTHCPQGHPYDEENTCRKNGRRSCRACAREYARSRRTP